MFLFLSIRNAPVHCVTSIAGAIREPPEATHKTYASLLHNTLKTKSLPRITKEEYVVHGSRFRRAKQSAAGTPGRSTKGLHDQRMRQVRLWSVRFGTLIFNTPL